MIKVHIKKEKEKIVNISFNGHALYDDFGKDIVCAAVSSCVITSLNLIIRIDEAAINIKQSNDFLNADILKYDNMTQTILINMIESLKEIETDYPKNITIKEELIC